MISREIVENVVRDVVTRRLVTGAGAGVRGKRRFWSAAARGCVRQAHAFVPRRYRRVVRQGL